jgi:hypothetical protein
VGTLPVLPQVLTGANNAQNMVRVFDLTSLNLQPGTYYIRVQAVPNVNAPVRGMTPATYWGAPSNLAADWARVAVTIITEPDTSLAAPVVALAGAAAWRSFNITDATDGDASGFNVYAFTSADAAATGDPAEAVAVSRNQSTSVIPRVVLDGLSFANAPPAGPADGIQLDVRLLQFENIGDSNATRNLPVGYTPADIGVSQPPSVSTTGNTSNLRPGVYWFRVSAVDATGEFGESPMAEATGNFSISIGPDEARGMMEAILADGGEYGQDFFIIDVRPAVALTSVAGPPGGAPGGEAPNEGILSFSSWLNQGGVGNGIAVRDYIIANFPVDPANPNAHFDVPIFLF